VAPVGELLRLHGSILVVGHRHEDAGRRKSAASAKASEQQLPR
jgi:hypothetical protein